MSFPMALTRGLLSIAPLKAAWQSASRTPEKTDAPVPGWLRRLCEVETLLVGGFPVTVLTPRRGPSGAQLVYLHGGAYVHPLLGAHWSIIGGLIRRTGVTVWVPSYGLAPEHTVDEAYPLLQEVQRRATDRARITEHTHPVFVAGDSAGGGLAVGLALRCRDEGISAAAALFLFSPWLDVTLSNPAIDALEADDPMLDRAELIDDGVLWAAERGTADPLVSPLNADRAELAELPPLHLYQGTADILLADAKLFAARAGGAGAEVTLRIYPGAIHVFVGAPWTPEAHRALADVAQRMHALT